MHLLCPPDLGCVQETRHSGGIRQAGRAIYAHYLLGYKAGLSDPDLVSASGQAG